MRILLHLGDNGVLCPETEVLSDYQTENARTQRVPEVLLNENKGIWAKNGDGAQIENYGGGMYGNGCGSGDGGEECVFGQTRPVGFGDGDEDGWDSRTNRKYGEPYLQNQDWCGEGDGYGGVRVVSPDEGRVIL